MSIGDGINYVGDLADSVSELVSSKKELVLKQMVNILLLLIILLVFGCFDWLHLTFHWEYLFDSNFWISIATKAAADIAAYNIGINVIIDDVIKRNKTLCKLKYIYENLNKYKDEDFEEYINLYNKECKKEAYKNYINFKIVRLNKFAKKKDKLLYSSRLREEEKLNNRYCIKRKQLEELKTDEYIDANMDSLEVRYRDIDAGIFELEINGSQKIIENKVTGSVNKGRILMSFTTLLGVIAGPIIINSISLDPNDEELVEGTVAAINYAIKIASDIAIIIWQFLRGIFSTHNIVSQQITMPLAERVKILKKYYSWRSATGKTVPQCYKDLIEEVKYVEMTEEELEKINV